MEALTLSEEQLDYLREMMNIGTGNAATALSRLLHQAVDASVPEIHICRLPEISAVLGQPERQVAGVRLEMTGDVEGYLFFIVPDSDRQRFTALLQRMTGKAAGQELPAMLEVASIAVESHLRAIRDFCGLNISHSSPGLAIDMVQAVLDEAIARVASRMPQVILIRSEFIIVGEHISTYLLIIPDRESVARLVDSMEHARKQLGTTQA